MNVPSRTGVNPAVGSKLVYGIIRDANLIDANLHVANLHGANLSGAGMQGTNLTDADYDAITKWPEGFDPEAAKAVLVEDDR